MTIVKIIIESAETGLFNKSPTHYFETDMVERKIENVIYDARYKHKDGTRLDFLKRTFKYLGETPQSYTFAINEDQQYLESLKTASQV